MNDIQSLSIEVPTHRCVNECPFCCSKIHCENYEMPREAYASRKVQIGHRLSYAKDVGVNNVILTGTGEALQNKKFIDDFSEINTQLRSPFYNIELQTTGVFLDKLTLQRLRDEHSVKTISLSVSDLMDHENNLDIIGVPDKLRFDFNELCKNIKDAGLNLRISLNVLDNLKNVPITLIFEKLKFLYADQVTFRKMWYVEDDLDISQNAWIKDNTKLDIFSNIAKYIKLSMEVQGILTYGAIQYSHEGMSVVHDKNCMDKDSDILLPKHRYMILRRNAKLYGKWDDTASLIF